MTDVTYRWIDGAGPNAASDEEWQRIDSIMELQGWPVLNKATSRILLAESGSEIMGFNVFQLYPHVEPLWVRPTARGTGVADELAHRMIQFVNQINTRGWMAVADSPHAKRLCEEVGMKLVTSPVYRGTIQ